MIQPGVFRSDEYVDYFEPDQRHNPFHAIYAAKRADIITTIRSSLEPAGAILDLGGGMGRMSIPLAQHYNVTLCDISPKMLRLAETNAREDGVPAGHLSTCQVDAAEPLPFSTATFDRALSIDLVVHLPDPKATLRELHRVLKPDGELVVDVTNSVPFWLLRYPRYVGRRPHRWLRTWQGGGVLPEWQTVVRHYRRQQFYDMLAATGFVPVDEWRYGPGVCPKWFLTRCQRRER